MKPYANRMIVFQCPVPSRGLYGPTASCGLVVSAGAGVDNYRRASGTERGYGRTGVMHPVAAGSPKRRLTGAKRIQHEPPPLARQNVASQLVRRPLLGRTARQSIFGRRVRRVPPKTDSIKRTPRCEHQPLSATSTNCRLYQICTSLSWRSLEILRIQIWFKNGKRCK